MSRFNFKTIAFAAAAFATPALAQAAICNNGKCRTSISEGDAFGNSNFGVGYDFGLSIYNKAGLLAELASDIETYSLLASLSDGGDLFGFFDWEEMAESAQTRYDNISANRADDWHEATIGTDVDATIFGDDMSIVQARAGAELKNGSVDAEASAYVLGAEVATAAFSSSEIEIFGVEMTFFEASATYMAGPIPLTVTGAVTGSVGATGSVSASGSSIALGITPNANLTADASVSVGVACVQAGVRGSLTLINVDVPTTFKILDRECGTKVVLESDIEMSTMDGSIEVFAEACLIEWDKELVSWDGAALDPISLIDQSTCF